MQALLSQLLYLRGTPTLGNHEQLHTHSLAPSMSHPDNKGGFFLAQIPQCLISFTISIEEKGHAKAYSVTQNRMGRQPIIQLQLKTIGLSDILRTQNLCWGIPANAGRWRSRLTEFSCLLLKPIIDTTCQCSRETREQSLCTKWPPLALEGPCRVSIS